MSLRNEQEEIADLQKETEGRRNSGGDIFGAVRMV